MHSRVRDFRRSGPEGSRFWHTDGCGAPQGSTFSPFDARGFEILCAPAVLCIPGFEILGLDRRKLEPCDENPPRARAQKIWKISGPKKVASLLLGCCQKFLGLRNLWVVALLAGFSFAGFDFFALPGSRALEGSRFSARQRQRVRVWARQRCCGPQGSKLECLARKTFEPCDPNPSCAGHHGESLKFPGICYCNSYCDFKNDDVSQLAGSSPSSEVFARRVRVFCAPRLACTGAIDIFGAWCQRVPDFG